MPTPVVGVLGASRTLLDFEKRVEPSSAHGAGQKDQEVQHLYKCERGRPPGNSFCEDAKRST